MKKCLNCGNNPYIEYPFGLLCLDCDLKFHQVSAMKIEESERQMNHILDEMDSVFGIYTGGRYPERKKSVVQSIPITMQTHNNITISKSVVGSVNTGVIRELDVNLHYVSQANDSAAQKIKEFAEAVLKEQGIQDKQKEEIIQQLNFLTQQLSLKPEQRNSVVISTVKGAIFSAVAFSANLSTIWETIKAFF